MLLWRATRSLKGIVQHRLIEPARQLPFPRRIGIRVQAEPPSLNRFISQVHQTNAPSPTFWSSHLHTSCPTFSQPNPFTIRNASRLGAPCLPRPPRVPGHVAHVGLGTARNFSTARPIFQHFIENVPVAVRATCEIDWDHKMREDRRQSLALSQEKKKTSQSKHVANKLAYQGKANAGPAVVPDVDEIQHYFQTLSISSSVVTYLQIPLAPTPTSRVPLSSLSLAPPQLLPLSALAREHALHSKHAIRVSSLFRRLDAARVWERGASCETYGDPSGLCTVLRVKFEGWTEDMVRQVLGLAGKDWCSIQEIAIESGEFGALGDPVQSDATPVMSQEEMLHQNDAWDSSSTDVAFVMPNIDTSVGFEWDSAISQWASLPLRSSRSPMFEADSFPSQSVWEDTPDVSPDWITECSSISSRGISPSPG